MQKKTDPRPALDVTRVVAAACLLLALAGQGLFMLRVLRLGLGLETPADEGSAAAAWAINGALLGLFAVQHSGMARAGFKTIWTRFVPACLERALYVGASGMLLAALTLLWQPLPGEPLWRGPAWIVAVAVAGAIGVVACSRFDAASFLGLLQAWTPEEPVPDRLLIIGPYRYVRHPLMTCVLLFLWGHPVMTPTLALLSGGLTLYVLAAIQLEERDLCRRFGPAYADYRRHVPALIPWRAPAPPATYAAIDR